MTPPPFVAVADGGVIRVQTGDESAGPSLVALGFLSGASDGEYLYDVHDQAEEAQLFSALRDAGVYFARGGEWSPAEVFERMRARGLVVGPFRSITWRGPDDWIAREE